MTPPDATATVVLKNEQGLHARPSALIVKTANAEPFKAVAVTLRVGTREADCKSIMEVMMLASPRGTELVFEARGSGAAAAVQALVQLVDAGFGE